MANGREYIDYNDTLREGTDKLNRAIDRAYDADEKATQAKQDVDNTLNTVNDLIVEINDVKNSAEEMLNDVDTLHQTVVTLADGVQVVVDEIEELKHVDEYDGNTAYKKYNIVTYNGSSYMAKQDTQGNPPTNTTYWGMLAQRGVDGTGSVSSVNNKLPDLDGNVEITADDVGAPTVQQHNELSQQVSAHLVDYASFKSDVGDKNNLLTTNKNNLVSAINEVFTTGNNVKSNTVGALLSVDPNLPITSESTWNDIISNIGNISTGLINPKAVKAGDFIVVNNDATRFIQTTTYTKAKEIQVFVSGKVRIKFNLRSESSGNTVNGRIFINDNAVGIERSTSSTNYVNFTQDIDVNEGDFVQLYIKSGGVGGEAWNNEMTLGIDFDLDQIAIQTFP